MNKPSPVLRLGEYPVEKRKSKWVNISAQMDSVAKRVEI